jgi:parallel beta-helix repeat protein
VVDRNIVTGSRGDGIEVQWQTTGTLLTKNQTSSNGDDGIDVDSTSATLTKNLAVSNGDLGIEAVVGVVDGGGNMAAGNGNPLQCTGVVCTAPQ